MGRGKNSNKMYISMKEHTELYGGKKEGEKRSAFRPLPFYCCSLTLQPFEDPVCTEDGIVFDIVNIVPYLKKHKKDPISGKPMVFKDLIKLHFHKNAKGEYHCPMTFNVFTDFSHIVAVRTSGHVYSMEAIDELNVKAKNWNDLMTSTPFTRKDIITIQDPQHLEKRDWSTFEHIKEAREEGQEGEEDPTKDINVNSTTAKVIQQYAEKEKEKEKGKEKEKTDGEKSKEKTKEVAKTAHAAQAPSFTSSSFTASELKAPHPADAPPKRTKKKGYVRIQTTLGNLNIEVQSDLVPKTSENFLELCESGYYDGVIFHRNIKNFMIQGGDPTGTGKGGQSIWKKAFKDEFKQNLLHNVRGVVSMANSGPNSNGSQFFITYNAAEHLNFKHSVFGKVVGGMEVLKLMEAVPTDETDRPKIEIKIKRVEVFVNPFRNLEEEEQEDKEKEAAKKKREENKYDEEGRGQWYSNPAPVPLKTAKTGVGKYIQTSSSDTPAITGKKRPGESLDVSASNKKSHT